MSVRSRDRRLLLGGLLAACADRGPGSPPPLDTATASAPDPSSSATEPPEGWWALVQTETPRLAFDREGCLARTGDWHSEGDWLPVRGTDGRFVVVYDDGSAVDAADVALFGSADEAPPLDPVTIALAGPRYALDADGCAQQDGEWAEGDTGEAVARGYHGNYIGLTVVSRDLSLAGVRIAEAPGWPAPWHASVQLVLPIPDVGYVIGGGVVVGPRTLLTAAHLGVDVGWCYAVEANTGAAAAAGTLVCDNVAGPAIPSPDGVDAAIVHLASPIGLPEAPLRTLPLEPDLSVLSSRWSLLHRNALADSRVDRIGNDNAFCEDWPEDASFVTADPIVAGGDSGGPAWVGDELVGLVHGERCRSAFEPVEHVFVNTVPLTAWVASERW